MAGRGALIVATAVYSDARLAALDSPASDAAALEAVLADAEIGGFDVGVVLDQPAAVVSERLESFFADRQRDDLLLVHFSGHGLKDDDGQLYLAGTDTRIDRLMSTGIEAGWINRLMHRSRSERVALFLDCCFAGSFSSAMTRRAGADRAGVREAFTGSGLVVITASDSMQYSFEAGRQVGQPPEPSPFTKALVDGLRTGEADRNEDGNISIDELFDYLEQRVRETSPAQTPTKSALNQTGDWVIARSTRTPSVRLLPERVQTLLRSELSIDRLEATMDLARLRSDPGEPRMAEAATKALEDLTADDSRRVALRAREVLGETPATTAAPAPASPAPASPLTASPLTAAQAGDVPPGTRLEPASGPTTARGQVRAWGQTDVLRGIVRGLLGSIIALGVLLVVSIVAGADMSIVNDRFPTWSAGVVVVSTIMATLAELGRLAVRAPVGSAWQVAASNRWLEAGIAGAAVALIGVVLGWLGGGWGAVVEDITGVAWAFAWVTGFSVTGFIVAEAIVGLRVPHRAA